MSDVNIFPGPVLSETAATLQPIPTEASLQTRYGGLHSVLSISWTVLCLATGTLLLHYALRHAMGFTELLFPVLLVSWVGVLFGGQFALSAFMLRFDAPMLFMVFDERHGLKMYEMYHGVRDLAPIAQLRSATPAVLK